MILTADVDNRSIRFVFFDDAHSPSPRGCLTLSNEKSADEIAFILSRSNPAPGTGDVTGAVVASVVPSVTSAVCEAISKVCPGAAMLAVGHGLRTGLDIRTDYQSELGADIVANAVGAKTLVKAPFCVVDLRHTATTLTLVDENERLQGVSIMPGLLSSARSLSADCANLPEVGITADSDAPMLGKNTADSITGGLINGFAAMTDGMLERLEAGFGLTDRLSVILTGVSSQPVASHMTHKVRVEQTLTAIGLLKILELNTKTK